MAENYVLIDDIIKNHTERMLNLRKFYPFFSLAENTFGQYKEGRFRFLDMGYITLAVLRFFINENSFNDRPVRYKDYEDFCLETLRRDFDLYAGGRVIGSQSDSEDIYSAQELEELVRYIFDKIRNYGKAFEFSFYEPAEKQTRISRVRFIDSAVQEKDVVYSITEDGIEFYLTTKEVRDESRINVQQLLLEKLIKSENFKGSMDVIQRINIEVKALEKHRQEVMKLLLTDVHAGTQAVDEYMERTSRWFAEEHKSFTRNRELVDKAVTRLTAGDNSRAASDILKLQTMLKQTIENHSSLIAATAELSRFSDEMVRRSRTRSLRNSFDYEAFLNRIISEDRPDILEMVVNPFMLPRRRKSMAIATIDNLVLQKTGDSLKGEEREELKADLDFRYEDEILSESVGKNFAKLFEELLGRLSRWDRVTLEEYAAILEVKFGKDVYKNRDYYSFLTHLAGKKIYKISELRDGAETFLEDAVVKYMKESSFDEYDDICFEIIFEKDEIKFTSEEGSELAEMSKIVFERRRD